MPSYLITGVSRGIGFEFLRALSLNPANTVIGLVRHKKGTDEKIAAANIESKNVHIFEGDLENYESLKKAAKLTASVTGGSLDYLIANAAYVSGWSEFQPIGDMGNDPKRLEEDLRAHFDVNVIGNVHLFNLFMPLILRGEKKKVFAISSGISDIDMVANLDLDIGAPYSISKAGLNLAVAKFSAQYREQGVLFLAICPGSVNTSLTQMRDEEAMANFAKVGAKFASYAPNFTGPVEPDVAVQRLLRVMETAHAGEDRAGKFVSHLGNKQWL